MVSFLLPWWQWVELRMRRSLSVVLKTGECRRNVLEQHLAPLEEGRVTASYLISFFFSF